MIEGFIKNNEFNYSTNLKVIDNKEIFLAIDGFVSKKYYHELINEYRNKELDFISNIKDYISIYLYDKKKDKLIIINDRIGAKKIYYYNENGNIYFSNSLKKLVTNKKYNLNIESLSMYFRFHYIPEPLTIYQDVFKLEHGHYILYSDGKLSNNCYWNLIDLFNNREIIKDYTVVENGLTSLLNKTIDENINNEKDINIYLSSGIDSSLLSSLCKKLCSNKINTYTIGFESERFNEANYSKKIANYLNTNHHELIIKNSDAIDVVKKIYRYYDEPFGDSSAASTIILNEFAKNNNVKLAITGDGADQLFCGVLIYDLYYKINRYSKFINPLHIHLNNKLIENNKLYYIFSNVPRKYLSQIDFVIYEKKLNGLFVDNGKKRFEYNIKTKNIQEERMILDLDTFMAQRVLPKMCIAAKVNNIDIIPPYLSHKVIEYSFKIPHKYKYHRKNKKYILKQMLFQRIPKEMFSNRKKGFGIPVKEWLKTELNDDLKRVSDEDYLKKQNIFNYQKVQSLINNIDNYVNLVWDYYMFQLWYEENKKSIK